MALIKSIAGIRGTIGGPPGENLTPLDIVKFTTGFARWLAAKSILDRRKLTVVVGRDARISGGMVHDLVEGTLLGCGVDVIDVGLCTTPGVELAITAKGADGGIVITASHNPRQWNALKLFDSNGEFIDAAQGAQVLALAVQDDFEFPEVDFIGRVVERSDFNGEHIDMALALPLVDVEAVKAKKFKVVVDAVNSVGGIVVPQLLRRMGVEVVCMNCEPNGEFAHNPEPLPEHLADICVRVVAEKADLGIVVDPDVDRLALVMENGELFGEEYTLVAVADYILSRMTGKSPDSTGNLSCSAGNTVSNLSSTRALNDITEKYGGKYFAAAVGEVNVVAKMKESGAVIGGEGNGGVIYPALHYGRDAIVGIALFMTHLALSGKSMSALRAGYPDYYICKNRLELAPDFDFDSCVKVLKSKYAGGKITEVDGLKIDFSHGWVHLRKSNTEPVVRIFTEARDRRTAEEMAAKIILEIEGPTTDKS